MFLIKIFRKKLNKMGLNVGQQLFEAVQKVTGFTPLESDMQEILSAVEEDNNLQDLDIRDFWKSVLGGNKPYGIKIAADGGTVTFSPGELNRFFQDYEKAKSAVEEDNSLNCISNSVFVVCQNDDYGRDLYLCTKNTIEEAKEVKGRDNTINIYEHEVFETDC